MVDVSKWRSAASWEAIQARAALNRQIREFFYQRGVMEVETPALGRCANPDPNIHSLTVESPLPALSTAQWFLHTSPEFAMKRLLASGSGPIYQICKVYRGHEHGSQHCPEFSMLEWYRPAFSLSQLMDEVDELLRCVMGGLAPAEKISYADLFQHYLAINPHLADAAELRAAAKRQGIAIIGMEDANASAWLDLLFSHCVQPQLGRGRPSFVYDFPASQSALARLNVTPRQGAARFELILEGVELANAYHELADAMEMRRRFEADLARRRHDKLPLNPYDEWVLEALRVGLPDCSGIALGLDRWLMLLIGAERIDDVLSFSPTSC